MVELYTPGNEIELGMLKGLLEEAAIPFFVTNDHIGSLVVGPKIDLYNVKKVMVHQEDLERAREITAAYFGGMKEDAQAEPPRYTLAAILRMFIEVFLFHWIMPGGRRKSKTEREPDQ